MKSTGDEALASSHTRCMDKGAGAMDSTPSSPHTKADIAEARRSGRIACTKRSSAKTLAPCGAPEGTHASAFGDRIQSLHFPPSSRSYADAMAGNAPTRLAYRPDTSWGTHLGTAPPRVAASPASSPK